MSDVDLSEFERLSTPRKPPCQVGVAREKLQPAERAQLDAALAADKSEINTGAIRTWLKRREHTVSISAVTYHRAGACTCHVPQ